LAAVADQAGIIDIVSRYADALRETISLEGVYLFGSYARGDATPESDIDVLVVSPDFSDDVIANQMLLLRSRRKIDLRIEPHPVKAGELNRSVLFSMIAAEVLKVV